MTAKGYGCVCVRKREWGRQRQRQRDSETERRIPLLKERPERRNIVLEYFSISTISPSTWHLYLEIVQSSVCPFLVLLLWLALEAYQLCWLWFWSFQITFRIRSSLTSVHTTKLSCHFRQTSVSLLGVDFDAKFAFMSLRRVTYTSLSSSFLFWIIVVIFWHALLL